MTVLIPIEGTHVAFIWTLFVVHDLVLQLHSLPNHGESEHVVEGLEVVQVANREVDGCGWVWRCPFPKPLGDAPTATNGRIEVAGRGAQQIESLN